MPRREATDEGCGCRDPYADLPPELRPRGDAHRANSLRRVTCPVCGLTYQTNRQTDLYADCERREAVTAKHTQQRGEPVKTLSIKILGPGCPNCKRLADLAKQALAEVQAEHPDLSSDVEKVTDPGLFLNYGLLKTPGLVINERLVSSGRLPSPSAIAGWMRDALAERV